MAKRERENRLNQLIQDDKATNERKKINMTPLGGSIAFNPATRVKSSLPLPVNVVSDKILSPISHWTSLDSEYISLKYKGKCNPKLVFTGKRKAANFLLEPMLIKDSNLGVEGNLNITGDLKSARFTLDLKPGCPKECVSMFPDLVNKQEKCLEFLHEKVHEGLKYAWMEDLWDKAGEHDDDESESMENFIKEGYLAWYKEYKDVNDNEKKFISMKRYLNTYDGKPNRPTFWKKNKEGEWKVYDVDSLPDGSLVQVETNMRFYNIEGDDGMYGCSMDIGDNILVIYAPKIEHSDNIPYIEF